MAPAKKFNPSDYLTKLKGKEYLEVKWRLVWFREDHPSGSIETDIVELTDNLCVIKARVEIPDGGRTTGYGSETPNDFKDYIEKAETKAIGRALAAMGYGTQFAPELDEGERVADAPVQRQNAPQPQNKPTDDRPINEATMKRLHALLAGINLNHDHLTAYAVDKGHTSSKNLTMGEATSLGTAIKDQPEVVVKYLTQLLSKAELAQVGKEVGNQYDAMKAGK